MSGDYNQLITTSPNPQQPHNSTQTKTKPNHSEHNHGELDSDCEGCQAEKKQNQKLVDFYQRLDKISTKVKKFKSSKNGTDQHQQNANQSLSIQLKKIITPQSLQQKIQELDKKINIPELPSVIQIKEFSSKQIGFQLAAALIEREMKYKNQNKKLQDRINQLLADKKRKESKQNTTQNSSFFHISKTDLLPQTQHVIRDSLNDLENSPKTTRKPKDDASFWDIQNTSTNNGFKYEDSTFFETKNKNRIIDSEKTKFSSRNDFEDRSNQEQHLTPVNEKKKNPYSTEQGYGLNLWLYQFKPQEYEQKVQSSWISDKNKSQVSERYQKINNLNKIPGLSNINKTSIIEKNLVSDYPVSVPKKRKNN